MTSKNDKTLSHRSITINSHRGRRFVPLVAPVGAVGRISTVVRMSFDIRRALEAMAAKSGKPMTACIEDTLRAGLGMGGEK